ncbi:MAG TPA: glycosyltransferase N-terminal domain-containing protein, partial [Bacteroidia bacterium]|nr:glycosyltransferase N-terminal domain-containing protein [Bacteroidia bacterium]
FLFIRFASLFNHKAKLWVKGRKNIFEKIESTLKEKIKPGDKVIWFHCASLGEFEQGRPVLEKLKRQNVKVVLTFFSPSGYEIRKNYEHADAVFYLPVDFNSNAKKFIELVKPNTAVFVKYEFWLNYLAELEQKKIPAYLISGVFRHSQHFFKWYGKNFFKALKGFKTLFVQDENSLNLLKKHGFTNGELAGDTRFDRVMQIIENKKSFPEIEKFCGSSPVIITGSSWPKDEEMILEVSKKLKKQFADLKLIIVPHEIDEASLSNTLNLVKNSGLAYAKFSEENYLGKDILVVDTVGMLSQLYQYATLAYIGGGFNNGIHNILEVMAYGIPVSFGPNYHKFVEAHEAEKLEIGKPVHNEAELFAFCSELLSNEEKRKNISVKIKAYMQSKVGATEKICKSLN